MGGGRSASRLPGRAACSRSPRDPVLPGEVPERGGPGRDPLGAVPGPVAYRVADLARKGRDPIALSADPGAGDGHGRPGTPRRMTQVTGTHELMIQIRDA